MMFGYDAPSSFLINDESGRSPEAPRALLARGKRRFVGGTIAIAPGPILTPHVPARKRAVQHRGLILGLTTWVKHIANAGGSAHRWVGQVDSARRDSISGWAYDRQNTAASVAVEAVTDSGRSCVTMADRQRDDLKDAGHGTGRYGFVLDLTSLDLGDEAVTVRFAEGRHPISKAPIKFDAERINVEQSEPVSAAAAGRWISHIDRVQRDCIAGWAFDRHNPTGAVTVEAVAGSGKSSVTVANLPRDDVKEAGHGTGLYGFVLDLTRLALKDETVIVRFAESRHPISNAPIEFDAQYAVLSTDMPPTYGDTMQLMAAMVRRAHGERGIAEESGR